MLIAKKGEGTFSEVLKVFFVLKRLNPLKMAIMLPLNA